MVKCVSPTKAANRISPANDAIYMIARFRNKLNM